MSPQSSDNPRAPSDPDRLTLGVEEEFHLVDLRTRRLTPRAGEVLAALEGSQGTYAAELQQTTVETNTTVVDTLDDLRRNLVDLRAELAKATEPWNRAGGRGHHAAGGAGLITETPVPRMLSIPAAGREQLICGLQIHVGIGDPDWPRRSSIGCHRGCPRSGAVGSSPFHTMATTRGTPAAVPSCGRAGRRRAARGPSRRRRVRRSDSELVASGVISDRGMTTSRRRPSAHVPTIELRVCDACHPSTRYPDRGAVPRRGDPRAGAVRRGEPSQASSRRSSRGHVARRRSGLEVSWSSGRTSSGSGGRARARRAVGFAPGAGGLAGLAHRDRALDALSDGQLGRPTARALRRRNDH